MNDPLVQAYSLKQMELGGQAEEPAISIAFVFVVLKRL